MPKSCTYPCTRVDRLSCFCFVNHYLVQTIENAECSTQERLFKIRLLELRLHLGAFHSGKSHGSFYEACFFRFSSSRAKRAAFTSGESDASGEAIRKNGC
jgi:hypothetical protein